ncbi:MAG: hypothetical protein HFE77_01785 [Clostridiales bacterium]|nr:hypothetical protein [Clostridiales bacterium]
MVERPAPLYGSESDQIRQIHDYLCRLADQLNDTDLQASELADKILENDCGTGVPLKDQFKAMKNIYGGGNNG